MQTQYQTNVVDTVRNLPEFSSRVYHYLLTDGWYNFDGESGFSDVDANDVAEALQVKPKAVNAALGHLIGAGLVFTEPYENHGLRRVGRGFKWVVEASYQIIYTSHNDGEPEHDDLLRYRCELEQQAAAEAQLDPESVRLLADATQTLQRLAQDPSRCDAVVSMAGQLLRHAADLG